MCLNLVPNEGTNVAGWQWVLNARNDTATHPIYWFSAANSTRGPQNAGEQELLPVALSRNKARQDRMTAHLLVMTAPY